MSDAMPTPAGTDLGVALPSSMFTDCRAVARNVPALERAVAQAVGTPPSLRFEDYPTEIPKREISVDDAAVRLAAALHLHLD